MKRTQITDAEFLARWKEGRYSTVRGAKNALFLVKGITKERRSDIILLIEKTFGEKPAETKAPPKEKLTKPPLPTFRPVVHKPEGVSRDSSNLDFVASLSRTELEAVCLFFFSLGLKMPEEADFSSVFFAFEQSGIKTNHASQVMHRLKNAR